MQNFAENVIEFNQKVLGIEQRNIGLLNDAELELSLKCLIEEANEFSDSHKKGDILGTIDGLIDLLYFGIGVLYKLGLNADQIAEIGTIVHNCNMAKKLGVVEKRGNGAAADAVKPEDWVGPEEAIARYLTAIQEH